MAELDFSVVVPTYNRPEALARCLEALALQHYPRDAFEIIVVDDGGEAPLDRIVKSFGDALPLRLVVTSHGGPAKARNCGAHHARGRFLGFTDDDCQVAPEWLATLAQAFEQAPDSMVGGRTMNGLPTNPYSSASQLIVDVVYSHHNTDVDQARFFASNNMAMPARLFKKIGGFDEGFVILACEDREFCDRWSHQCLNMRYVPQAVVYHFHPLTLREFCKQHFTYGRGAVHYHRIRAQRGSGLMRQEMKFHLHLRNWLTQPFRRTGMPRALLLFGLLVLWQLANLAGFVSESLISTGYRRARHAGSNAKKLSDE